MATNDGKGRILPFRRRGPNDVAGSSGSGSGHLNGGQSGQVTRESVQKLREYYLGNIPTESPLPTLPKPKISMSRQVVGPFCAPFKSVPASRQYDPDNPDKVRTRAIQCRMGRTQQPPSIHKRPCFAADNCVREMTCTKGLCLWSGEEWLIANSVGWNNSFGLPPSHCIPEGQPFPAPLILSL